MQLKTGTIRATLIALVAVSFLVACLIALNTPYQSMNGYNLIMFVSWLVLLVIAGGLLLIPPTSNFLSFIHF